MPPQAQATRPPLVLIRQHFGGTVFDRRTSRYLPFDREATDLLLRLASQPIDSVLSGLGDEQARAVWDFFERFHRIGFFTIDGRFDGVVLDNPVPSDHLVGPLAVHLEVVAACNLSCRHCFAGALPRKEDPLTLAEPRRPLRRHGPDRELATRPDRRRADPEGATSSTSSTWRPTAASTPALRPTACRSPRRSPASSAAVTWSG